MIPIKVPWDQLVALKGLKGSRGRLQGPRGEGGCLGGRAGQPEVVQEVLVDLKSMLSN